MEPNHRCCVGCRNIAHREQLWRIVRQHSSGTVLLDEGMGRSAYVCPKAECLKAAQRKNRLGKALRVFVPDSIYRQLWQRLQGAGATNPHTTSPS
ncbi:MAG: YlxR family protein [Leptolyngbyaceae cyanobacterium]